MGWFGDTLGAIGSGITGGLGNIVGGMIGAGASKTNTSSTNRANEIINQRNIDFNREQNEIMREREDNAYQRKAADLEQIGINPIMAGLAGGAGAGAGGGIGAPSAIGMQKNDVGEIIANTGANISGDIERGAKIDKLKAEKETILLHNTIDQWDFAVTQGSETGMRYKDSNQLGQVINFLESLTQKITDMNIKEALGAIKGKIENTGKNIFPKVQEEVEEFKEKLKDLTDLPAKKIRSTDIYKWFKGYESDPSKSQKEWTNKQKIRDKWSPKNYRNPLQ